MRIHETPSRVAVAACATNGALTTNNAAHNVLTIQGVGCRGYNNAFTAAGRNPWDSNHRFSLVLADITALVNANGWKDDGEVFCALP